MTARPIPQTRTLHPDYPASSRALVGEQAREAGGLVRRLVALTAVFVATLGLLGATLVIGQNGAGRLVLYAAYQGIGLVIAGVLVLVLRALVKAKRPGVGDLRAPARAICVLGVREGESWARFGPLASAVLFGAIHWFGIPGGPVGALMAGFLGWVLARSILDTRGIGWAWFIHFCQDVLIFTATLVLFV